MFRAFLCAWLQAQARALDAVFASEAEMAVWSGEVTLQYSGLTNG